MTTPSKADVLLVAGEPVAIIGSGYQFLHCRKDWSQGLHVGDFLYTESQLLAMYAAGQESAKADGWRQCAVGQHTSQFCWQAEKARAEGAEDMREKVIGAIKDSDDQLMGDFHIERIRALPITTNTEGEQGNG